MSSVVINHHATNVSAINKFLKIGFFGGGIWYGLARHHSLTRFVGERKLVQAEKLRKDLIEEALIVYDTMKMKEMALVAKADGSIFILTLVSTIDPNSYKFDGDAVANWALSKFDPEPTK